SLIPEPDDLPFLNVLLDRFGASVRYLKIAGHGPNRLGSNALALQLAKCKNLEKLSLSGFRGRDLENFCQSRCHMPTLRFLTIECDPYFNLGSFSHNTGAHMASLPISWLTCFPNLEGLVCDYLKVEASDISEDAEACDADSTDSEGEVVFLDSTANPLDVTSRLSEPEQLEQPEQAETSERSGPLPREPREPREGEGQEPSVSSESRERESRGRHAVPALELPLAALSPRRESRELKKESREGSEAEQPQLKKLKDLSFVAVVRGSGSTWHSSHCRCDLSVLARLAPGLRRLFVRSPNIALGRMSRRPGQRIEGLIRVGASDVLAAKLRRTSSAAASPASVSAFHSFAVSEQHLPLLQCLQKFQEQKDQKEQTDLQMQEFEVDIVEAA
ncbi:unnamed protein product, partial [Symbiodinium pilosum]